MNYAEHAKQLSNAELAAVAKAYNDELQKRSTVNVQGADPTIAAMLQKEHAERFGDANPRAVAIAAERHRKLYG